MNATLPHPRRLVAWLAFGCAAGVAGIRAEDDRAVAPAVGAPAGVPAVGFGFGFGRPAEFDLGAMFDGQVLGRHPPGAVVVRAVGPRPAPGVPAAAPAAPATEEAVATARRRGQARIAVLERICGLSVPQRRALELAIASDLRGVVEEIDACRVRYAGVRLSAAGDRSPLQQLQADVATCRRRLESALGPGSLFDRLAADTLDDRQRAAYATVRAERRACRWRATVALLLVQVDEPLALAEAQRAGIERALLAEVPPLRVDAGPGLPDQREQLPVPYALVQLAAAAGRGIGDLDERQRQVLAGLARRCGDPGALVRMLVERGVLEESP